MSNLIHIDEEYKTWINNLSLRFKQSQIKAAINIKRFYVTYYKLFAKLPQLGEELGKESLPQLGVNISAEKMVFNELMSIPWNHHKYIMDKFSKDMPKAMFYVHQTYINNWSRSVLLNFLDSDLYETSSLRFLLSRKSKTNLTLLTNKGDRL